MESRSFFAFRAGRFNLTNGLLWDNIVFIQRTIKGFIPPNRKRRNHP